MSNKGTPEQRVSYSLGSCTYVNKEWRLTNLNVNPDVSVLRAPECKFDHDAPPPEVGDLPADSLECSLVQVLKQVEAAHQLATNEAPVAAKRSSKHYFTNRTNSFVYIW